MPRKKTLPETIKDNVAKSLLVIRRWDEEEKASRVMRRYLSETDGKKSNLDKLLDRKMELAMQDEDKDVALKAINSSLEMAAGAEKAAVNVNTQINLGDFLNNLEQ